MINIKKILVVYLIMVSLFPVIAIPLAILLLALLMYSGFEIPKKNLRLTVPLLSIFLVAFISSIPEINLKNYYYYGRDIYYLCLPILYVIFGSLFSNRLSTRDFIRTVIIAITVSSLITLIGSFSEVSNVISLAETEGASTGLGNIYSALVFGLLFILHKHKNTNFYFGKTELALVFFINTLSVLLSFSRTLIFATFLLIAILYISSSYKRKIIILIMSTIISSLFLTKIVNLTTSSTIKETTFHAKLLNSFSEVFTTNYDNSTDINHNWRGYESNLGVDHVVEGGMFSIIAGRGLGSYASTPSWVFDFDSALDTLPIFHNGYVTILLKAGIIGYLLFVIFLLNAMKNQEYIDYIYSAVLLIIFWTFVIHGIYNGSSMPIILIFLSYFSSKSKSGSI